MSNDGSRFDVLDEVDPNQEEPELTTRSPGMKYINTRLPTILKNVMNNSNSRIVITKTLREEHKLCDENKTNEQL